MTFQASLVRMGEWSASAKIMAGGDLDNNVSLSATGNNTSTGAYLVTKDITVVATASGTQNSMILPNYGSAYVLVFNNTASTINVFPPIGGSINGLAANASFAITANKSTTFVSPDGSYWVAQHAG